MADVVKKLSISSELAQKMVDAAVAKAGELGVRENVAILDDGGNLTAFRRMDGPRSSASRWRRTRRTRPCSASPLRSSSTSSRAIRRSWLASPRFRSVAAWGGGFPIKVDGEIVGAIGVSGAPAVQNDVDCANAALALVPDAVPAD